MEEPIDPAQRQKFLEVIDRHTGRMERLGRDLLSWRGWTHTETVTSIRLTSPRSFAGVDRLGERIDGRSCTWTSRSRRTPSQSLRIRRRCTTRCAT